MLLSGIMIAALGCLLVFQMPLTVLVRMSLLVLWLATSAFELYVHSRAASQIASIGLNDRGQIWVRNCAGERLAAELLPGTVVLGRLAWLRLRLDSGKKYAEFLRGKSTTDPQWHLFQLIWEQSRQTFGGLDRS